MISNSLIFWKSYGQVVGENSNFKALCFKKKCSKIEIFNNITPQLLKEVFVITSRILREICNNQIIKSKHFPENLNVADVVPGHKKKIQPSKNHQPVCV